MKFALLPAYDKTEEIRQLFGEYTAEIIRQDPVVAETLVSQGYEQELADLRGKYGPPDGRLYLAEEDGQAAGCGALHRLEGDLCEIKRIYVRPQYRGHGLGKLLTEKIIEDAKQIGYRGMRLDTFPFMDKAVRMYQEYGFYTIERYNDNPADNAIFMQLDL